MMDSVANSVVVAHTHDAIVPQGEPRNPTRRRRQNRSGVFTCQDCGRTLSRHDALVRHARTAHGAGKAFWCPEEPCLSARKGFKRFQHYRNHMRHVHNKVVSQADLDPHPQSNSGSEASTPVSEFQNLPQHDDKPELQINAESEIEYEIKRDVEEIAQHLPYPPIQPQSPFLPQYSPQYHPPNITGQAFPYVPDLNNDYSGGCAFRAEDTSQSTLKTPFQASSYAPDLNGNYGGGPAFRAEDTTQSTSQTPFQASLYAPDLNGNYGGGPAFRKEDGLQTGRHQVTAGPSPEVEQPATSPNQLSSAQGGANIERTFQIQNTPSNLNPNLVWALIQQRERQIRHQQNKPSSPFTAPTA